MTRFEGVFCIDDPEVLDSALAARRRACRGGLSAVRPSSCVDVAMMRHRGAPGPAHRDAAKEIDDKRHLNGL
jgi:hypothetical protein